MSEYSHDVAAKPAADSTGRILVLATDAYGGHGGISRFNRDLLEALALNPGCGEIVVFPRLVRYSIEEPIPEKIRYIDRGITSKSGYVKNVLSWLIRDSRFDALICGHINLLPIAWPLAKAFGLPLLMIIHGIDAWTPTKSRLANLLASRVDGLIAVSRTSADRFCGWSRLDPGRIYLLPNCVDLSDFSPGPKNPDLVARYGLAGNRVLMTLGRMPGRDRYKGYDEIIEVLPELLRRMPDLVYLLGGDGPDRPRLEQKAAELGVGEKVVFVGMVAEDEKADHYRLADAYVMPSRGEGFGIVLLEAMACGIPTLASKVDGGREALRDGSLGILVDPENPDEIIAGVEQVLALNHGVPEGLDYFSKRSYRHRVHHLIGAFLENSGRRETG